MDTPQTRSVQNLENLYSVVIGAGLSLAIFVVVDSGRSPVPLKLELLPYFLSYLVTLIPFYHGALRHLDSVYIENSGPVRSGALLLDFLGLFAESCVFLALAVLLPAPQVFACGVVVLLLVDIIWGLLAHIAVSKQRAEVTWAYINIITAVVLTLVLVLLGAFPPSHTASDVRLSVSILFITLARSAIDYGLNWKFYYPS